MTLEMAEPLVERLIIHPRVSKVVESRPLRTAKHTHKLSSYRPKLAASAPDRHRTTGTTPTCVDLTSRPFHSSGTARVPSIQSRSSQTAKRTGDLVIGTIMCILTSVLVVGLMVGSAISFKAMPFFTQARIGKRGRSFRIVKIRSLPASAPSDADKYQLKVVRNTGFGRFIRGSHLDELPQLWLVVRGRMSLVGPRPDMPHIVGRFGEAHSVARAAVRPGCTGLWQVSPATEGMIYEAPEYDLFYAEQMCGRLDLWILWRTVLQFAGGSTKTLDEVPRWACAHPSRAGFQRHWSRYAARAA
jgi:lipopolysaccharide/colanic/teichoic acid biosynthesis glycosyltransferase